jgi:uncharacterized membrane protein/acyl-CoA synthetase (AMP-forming)/AMP-acid ligase II/3-hydroxymyristoyl/3-hydroxydecanoyl-(acyl carrier protein) dehydratase
MWLIKFMKWLSSRKLLAGVTLVLTLAYPFAIYFLGRQVSPSFIVMGLIAMLIVRSILQYRDQGAGNFYMTLMIVGGMSGIYFFDGQLAALMYPVVMSCSFAFLLGWSLVYPPSLIEQFARLVEKDFDARGVAYTRKVTIVWLIFSFLNACISFATVMMNDQKIWLLYNSCISYGLMGLLMGGEYLFRGYYKNKGNKIDMNKRAYIPVHQLLALRNEGYWKSYWNSSDFPSYPNYIGALVAKIKQTNAKRIFLIHEDRAYFLAGFFAALYAGVPVVLPQSDAPELLMDLMQPGDMLLTNPSALEKSITAYISMDLEYYTNDSIEFAPLDPKLAVVIFYTSGSTGKPKAVEKRLFQLEAEVEVLQSLFGKGPQATFLSTVSHHHLYALLYSLLWPVCGGFNLDRHTFTYWGDVLRKSKAGDFLISSPAHLGRFSLLEECTPIAFRSVFSSGALLSYEAAVESKKYLGSFPFEVYGSTETGGIAFRQQTQPEIPWKRFSCVEISSSQEGKLRVKSPYLAGSEFYQTEDLIHWVDQNTQESFHLLGRADRIVKVEGKRVSLVEVEDQLCKSEWVAEAAVLVLEKSYREELGAVIVLSPLGLEKLRVGRRMALIRSLREALCLYFHAVVIPRKWRFVDGIPTNAQGKRQPLVLKKCFDKIEKPALGPVRHPIILRKEVSENKAEYFLKIPHNLAYFEGHFQKMPVVPGVVQLNWVVELAKVDFGLTGGVLQGNQIKFTRLMKPSDEVSLILQYNTEKSSLSYSYKAGEMLYSSGRMTISTGASNGI